MADLKLLMLMLGCTPRGRNTEQHDIYFTLAPGISETVPGILSFWPEANGRIHVDAWREVRRVDNFSIDVISKKIENRMPDVHEHKLFFINLGGYKENEFDEFHYKMLIPATDKSQAIKKAKLSAFYKHTGFAGAPSHIDDKYGIDVDDIHDIADILPPEMKDHYFIRLAINTTRQEDELHLGYFPLDSL